MNIVYHRQISTPPNVVRTSGWGSSSIAHQNIKAQPITGNSGHISSGILATATSPRELTTEVVRMRPPMDENTSVNRPNQSVQALFHPDIANKLVISVLDICFVLK